MARINKTTTFIQLPKSPINYIAAILKGVALSIIISIICALILSVIVFVSDSGRIDEYLGYIMLGVTLVGIFAGSAYAARKIANGSVNSNIGAGNALLVGISIGIIYVLFSVGISSDLGQNQILLPMLGNKIAAGSLAGALGGFIGINI